MAEEPPTSKDDALTAGSRAGGSTRTLNILMVSARYAPFVGGTEIHTGRVSEELTARGHRVTVLTTDLDGSLPVREQVGKINVIRLPAYPSGTDLHIAPKLRKMINSQAWDLVHVQGYHTAVAPMALAAAQRQGIPNVLTFHSGGHSSRVRNLLRPVQVRLLQKYLLRADRLFGVSEFEASLFGGWLGLNRNRIKVIPNGVSPSEAESPAADRGLPDDGAYTILSVGRLVRYKGHHRVIQAMPHLLRLEPNTKLLILGNGPYEGNLRRLAKKLRVDHAVRFDYIPSDESHRLRAILRDASLAVLLSDYESHGMAAHEALTVGLPLAVMDKSALGELVTSGLAQAIPPKASNREVAEIVVRCLHRPIETSNGPLARSHSWSTITDRLEEQYFQVVDGADGSPGPSSQHHST